MKLEAMYLIGGRGWVAQVELAENENYKCDDEVLLGGIVWTVKGIEQYAYQSAPRKIGLVLRPERISNKTQREPDEEQKITDRLKVVNEVQQVLHRTVKAMELLKQLDVILQQVKEWPDE